MANNPISMSKVRQIIKLYSKGIGKRKIAQRLCVSKNIVKCYLEYFSRLNTTVEELSKLSDFELNKLFNPRNPGKANQKLIELHEFFPIVDKQMRRRGMTIAKQWREYNIKYPNGYKETQFYGYYAKWCKRVYPSMHMEHKAGDKMFIDFAGGTLPYVDTSTGEIKKAQVFVSILGASQYTYVEALESQAIEDLITGTENAFCFFNGVPLAVVPDNLKSAVSKASNYEPILNENFRAFADHYGTTILPARSRKPQDKAHVENAVKIIYQRIYANLPEKQILSLKELNEQIIIHLNTHNKKLLTGKDCSRADQMIVEQSQLQPLPERRYEMRKIKQVTVMKNGHVFLTEDHHYYSVPYEMIGKKLRMQYSKSEVDLYLKYELVASHKRIKSPHNYSTEPSHLAPQHRYITEWNPNFFLQQARGIDPTVEYFIDQVLRRKAHPEQAYKSCQGILSFARCLGSNRLIKACERAHSYGIYNYKIIEDILRKNLDQFEDDPEPVSMPAHENIRGKNYYQ